MRSLGLALSLAFLPTLVWATSDAGRSAADVRGSVVSVLPLWAEQSPIEDEPEGSGVVVGDGRTILTADHILGNPAGVRVRTADGEYYEAEIKGRDPVTDLALLGIEERLPIANLAKDLPDVGEAVCAVGNSFGLDLSVTCGTVSAVSRSGVGFNPIEDFVQTDAAVNPGMSGGALVDADGDIVGLLSAIFTKTSDADIGVNFAVSTRLIHAALPKLEQGGLVKWPTLGVVLEARPEQGESGTAGAEIIHIIADMPGDASPLLTGDLILNAAGERIRSPDDWAAIEALNAGRSIAVRLRRDGEILDLDVALPTLDDMAEDEMPLK